MSTLSMTQTFPPLEIVKTPVEIVAAGYNVPLREQNGLYVPAGTAIDHGGRSYNVSVLDTITVFGPTVTCKVWEAGQWKSVTLKMWDTDRQSSVTVNPAVLVNP